MVVMESGLHISVDAKLLPCSFFGLAAPGGVAQASADNGFTDNGFTRASAAASAPLVCPKTQIIIDSSSDVNREAELPMLPYFARN
jgi:hypothetical protein